jgi:hypothetical protein
VVVVAEVVASELRGLAVDGGVESSCSSFVLLDHLVERLGEVDELADTTTSSLDTIEGRENLVKLGDVGHDGTLIGSWHVDDIFGIENASNIEVLLGNVEGKVEVTKLVVSVELFVVDEIGSVSVDQSTESKTVLERDSEVLDIDVVVWLGLSSAPQEETFLGGKTFLAETGDSETKNDGPDETEGHLQVTVDDFFGSNVGELDTVVIDELECLAAILDAMDSHLGCLFVLAKALFGNDLQKSDEVDPVTEILSKRGNLLATLNEVGVDPVGEGLGLDALPLLNELALNNL